MPGRLRVVPGNSEFYIQTRSRFEGFMDGLYLAKMPDNRNRRRGDDAVGQSKAPDASWLIFPLPSA